jgi:serine/threonine-protein kinase
MLDALLSLPEAERGAYLDRHCGAEPALRAQIEALLEASGPAFAYFDELGNRISKAAVIELEAAAAPQIKVGPYATSRIIGHGGMGTVYLAERSDGQFEQRVALKLIRLDMEGESARRLFERERRILAQMRHPNVAQLLDGGVTADNRPYLVMEWVDGVPLIQYCDRERLGVRARLRLFLQLCSALEHLHRHLVVHRDLKPGNVLVTGAGVVKLVDFGIAKLIDDQQAEGATGEDTRVLTPDYAAPEQLSGGAVTTATDIYGLGVLLYELLAGRRPHGSAGGSPLTHAQAVVADAPDPPSAVVARDGESRTLERLGVTRARARRRIAGDLDNVCLVALRKEPARRYASVTDLGADIRAHLDGRPVAARGDRRGYRLGKLVRRHPTAFAASGLALVLVAGAFVHETGLRAEAQRAGAQAAQEARKAQATSQFLQDILASARPENARGREITVREVVDAAAQRLASETEVGREQQLVQAGVHATLGETYRALGSLRAAAAHFERALEIRRAQLGELDPDTIDALGDLGRARYALGEYDAAEPMLTRALALSEQVHGAGAGQTVAAIADLASLYWAQGRLAEVEPLDRRNLAMRADALGPEHPDTLKSLHNLGVLHYSLGNPGEAEGLLRRAYDAQRATLGETHPDTLSSAANLAAALERLGHYQESLDLSRDTSRLRHDVLGPGHPDTLRARHNVAGTLRVLGEFDEAERTIREVLSIQERSLGRDNRDTCASRLELAEILFWRGRVDDARRMLEEEARLQPEIFGATHWQSVAALGSLAELYAATGDLAGLERMIPRLREAVPERNAPVLEIMTAHAERLRGRYAAALERFDAALDGYGSLHGERHPHTLRARLARAATLRALGRKAEAAGEARAVIEIAATALGNDRHPVALAAGELIAAAPADAARHAGAKRN